MKAFSNGMRVFNKAFDKVLDFTGGTVSVALVTITLLLLLEVVMRYFLALPTKWGLDYCTYLTLVIAFLGSAWLLRIDRHTKIDVFLLIFNPRQRKIVTGVMSIIGCLVVGLFCFVSGKSAIEAYQKHFVIVRALSFPSWILLTFMFIGTLLLVVQFARRAYVNFSEDIGIETDKAIVKKLEEEDIHTA